jgi:hypothetical protein
MSSQGSLNDFNALISRDAHQLNKFLLNMRAGVKIALGDKKVSRVTPSAVPCVVDRDY